MFASLSPRAIRLLSGLGLFVALGVVFTLLARDSRCAEPAELSSRLQAHLRVGEFGVAKALAGQLGSQEERDHWLGRIALAQARFGGRRASVSTLADVYDDRVRGSMLDQIRGADAGAAGGNSLADFTELIDLITTTIKESSWEAQGGPGRIEQFTGGGGVYVDPQGVLRLMSIENHGDLAEARSSGIRWSENHDARRPAALRKVSLTRLERAVQASWALGLPLTDEMKHLAGIHKIKYVFVYPETGDIVVAGPAGDWMVNAEGRHVSVDTGHPILQLDDLVVLLRNGRENDARFGCSIMPSQESLAKAKQFLEASSQKPLRSAEQRDRWLVQLRDQLGKQNIEVFGLDPETRVARTIVEADYRMKLVGMGLEEAVPGVTSYLDSVKLAPGEAAPPMSVLRWWFTLNYDALRTTPARDAFELHGPGVQVQSENEMLTDRGERVHTGASDELNRQFARSFTKHFSDLAVKYPIYAELQNIFDIALVAALIEAEDLASQVGWHMVHFGDEQKYRVEKAPAPGQVETVINHRVLNRTQILAGVSGGVSVDAGSFVKRDAIQQDEYGLLKTDHTRSVPKTLPRTAWWWD